ncbi:MAG: PfkB family carbohydrate kinase, partial [Candidatus Omnitrophica bacterium]|nr:PfkB family carbohydrate kinase [Candidatus Omnitrophota bacterium]
MERLSGIIQRFHDKKILVIGDLMLDKFISGNFTRISPEAPVPIVDVENEEYDLGGAANVASNISTLGGNVIIFGFRGEDSQGEILESLLAQRNIKHFLGINSKTTLKERVIMSQQGRKQQFLRIDYDEPSIKIFSSELKSELMKEAASADMIVISDYAKGVITSDLMGCLSEFKHKIIVDPKPKNSALYKGVYLITPNDREALGMAAQEDVFEAGKKLKNDLISNILITRGHKGMALFSDKLFEVQAQAQNAYDVVGAGDTVIAALALALSAGASLEDATIIANYAAGIAVSKAG